MEDDIVRDDMVASMRRYALNTFILTCTVCFLDKGQLNHHGKLPSLCVILADVVQLATLGEVL